MLDDYYAVLGWNNEGIVPDEIISKL